ncbi:MAG: hypothetical protein V1798_10175 [Pseudomonadota bacterium]
MKRNAYIFILALLFWGASWLFHHFGFWTAVGLPVPHGYLAAGFLFLGTVLLLQNVLFRPYLRVVEEREAQTIHKAAAAAKTRGDAERMISEYRRAVEAAHTQATLEREKIALAGENEERGLLKDARARANRELTARLGELEEEARRLEPALLSQVDALALDVLNRVIVPKPPGGTSPGRGPRRANTER